MKYLIPLYKSAVFGGGSRDRLAKDRLEHSRACMCSIFFDKDRRHISPSVKGQLFICCNSPATVEESCSHCIAWLIITCISLVIIARLHVLAWKLMSFFCCDFDNTELTAYWQLAFHQWFFFKQSYLQK